MGITCPERVELSRDTMALTFGTDSPIDAGTMRRPRSFCSVIDLWPTREAMAVDVGASSEAVRKWVQRDFIPAEWWTSVLRTDRAKSAGVTADLLAKLASHFEEARA